MDEETRMMRDSLLICACFWGAILSLGFLPACTPTATVQHEVPQLQSASDSIRKTSDSIRNAVDKMADLNPPVQCRKLDLPMVPPDVVLDIKGDKITANEGGEIILRGYVRCRSLYRDAPISTEPTPKP